MYHTLIIVGNVGRDPEMRYTPSGQAVTSFSVATNREYTGQGGDKVKETIWFRVSTWGKLAETCQQFLRKGSKVLIEGRLNPDKESGGPRVWEDNKGGGYKASYEVTASTVRFLSSKDEGGAVETARDLGGEVRPEDDIPF